MKKRYYAAYGSNLNVQQMLSRCPDAEVAGVSIIKDYRLLFRGSKTGSYLTVEPGNGHNVPVAIWKVSAADEKALDRYEGCPIFYYKKEFILSVNYKDNTIHQHNVFAYIMHEDRPLGLPTAYYMKTCLQGYRNFKFNEQILHQAYIYTQTQERN